jgi:hypothetical protein
MPSASYAGTISYGCTWAYSECKGQTFAAWGESVIPGFYDISVSIDTSGYKGRAEGSLADFAYGVEIKDLYGPTGAFVYSTSTLQLLDAPGGALTDWKVGASKISSACDGAVQIDTACAIWIQAGTFGVQFAVGDILTWTFRMQSSSALPDMAGHVRYWYMDSTGGKIGGLLDGGFAVQSSPATTVPEGGSTLMFALLGLVAVGAGVRTAPGARGKS